jgi:hypothetical protein
MCADAARTCSEVQHIARALAQRNGAERAGAKAGFRHCAAAAATLAAARASWCVRSCKTKQHCRTSSEMQGARHQIAGELKSPMLAWMFATSSCQSSPLNTPAIRQRVRCDITVCMHCTDALTYKVAWNNQTALVRLTRGNANTEQHAFS